MQYKGRDREPYQKETDDKEPKTETEEKIQKGHRDEEGKDQMKTAKGKRGKGKRPIKNRAFTFVPCNFCADFFASFKPKFPSCAAVHLPPPPTILPFHSNTPSKAANPSSNAIYVSSSVICAIYVPVHYSRLSGVTRASTLSL